MVQNQRSPLGENPLTAFWRVFSTYALFPIKWGSANSGPPCTFSTLSELYCFSPPPSQLTATTVGASSTAPATKPSLARWTGTRPKTTAQTQGREGRYWQR